MFVRGTKSSNHSTESSQSIANLTNHYLPRPTKISLEKKQPYHHSLPLTLGLTPESEQRKTMENVIQGNFNKRSSVNFFFFFNGVLE